MCSIENPFKSSRNDPPCDDAEQFERDGVVAESDSTPINPFSFSSLYDSMMRCKKRSNVETERHKLLHEWNNKMPENGE